MQLDDLEKVHNKIEEICVLLNPEDAYWLKELLVKAYEDDDLLEQAIEMLVTMGYTDDIIIQVGDLIKELQSLI